MLISLWIASRTKISVVERRSFPYYGAETEKKNLVKRRYR